MDLKIVRVTQNKASVIILFFKDNSSQEQGNFLFLLVTDDGGRYLGLPERDLQICKHGSDIGNFFRISCDMIYAHRISERTGNGSVD